MRAPHNCIQTITPSIYAATRKIHKAGGIYSYFFLENNVSLVPSYHSLLFQDISRQMFPFHFTFLPHILHTFLWQLFW